MLMASAAFSVAADGGQLLPTTNFTHGGASSSGTPPATYVYASGYMTTGSANNCSGNPLQCYNYFKAQPLVSTDASVSCNTGYDAYGYAWSGTDTLVVYGNYDVAGAHVYKLYWDSTKGYFFLWDKPATLNPVYWIIYCVPGSSAAGSPAAIPSSSTSYY